MGPKKSHASTGHIIHLVCPHCSKEFTGNSSTSGVRSNYKRHLLVHSGERPFSCQFCHETFTTKPNMRRHVAAAHPEQRTPTRALQEAAAGTQDTAAPPPPLELPTTTTSTASPTSTTTSTTSTKAAASVATRTKLKEVSATTTPEPSGVSSSGDPEKARSTAENSIANTTAQTHEPEEAQEEKAPAVFTCEDCELELSSKAKLRRHQRYYCPFRDTITADPVQDALNQYRAEQQQQQQELEQHQLLRDDGDEDSDDEYGNAFDDSDADVLPSSRRRGRRDKKAALMTLTEEEKAYLTRVAAQSGLKFVEDAYVSESGSDDVYDASDASGSDSEADEENESCSQSSSSSSSSALLSDFNKRKMRRTPKKDKLLSPSLLHTSPKRTPLHGPLPSPDRKQLRSPRWSAGAEGGARASGGTPQGQRNTALPQTADAFFLPSSTAKPTLDGEKDESDVDPGEDLLHLHYHRRGSGHKRERLILKKRLRAQEGALLGLTTSPLRRPQKQRRREASALELPVADSSTTSADGLTVIATAVSSGSRSAAHRPDERATTAITVSEQLASRADSLLTLNWRQAHRNKVSVSSEFVCPYCDDFTAFASQRLLTAHQQRMHPAEVARALARAATQENSEQEGTTLPFEE